MRQIFFENASAILLQNTAKVYYKMRQVLYYKMRQFYYKMGQLLQNPMFVTKCVRTDYFVPGTSRESLYHELRLESLLKKTYLFYKIVKVFHHIILSFT